MTLPPFTTYTLSPARIRTGVGAWWVSPRNVNARLSCYLKVCDNNILQMEISPIFIVLSKMVSTSIFLINCDTFI